MIGFKNVRAHIHGKGIVVTNVGIEDGKIAYIGDDGRDIEPVADCEGCLLSPGFIDEHIHGAAGVDVMDGDVKELQTMAESLVKEGTTTFLATTMTQREDILIRALNIAAEYSGETGARLGGIHLEGPFISQKRCGAQPVEYIVKPSVEQFRRLQRAAGGKIKIATVAPEEDGDGLIEYLNAQGITASCGHSDATCSQVLKSGITCITHTFNAQSPFNHREPGVVGAALLSDKLCCEIIADTIHVAPEAITLLIKSKPADKVVLITDAIRAKGMGNGVAELGGQLVYVKDGQARLENGTLAGSVLKMNEAVKNLVQKCGVSIEYALDCATYNPAQNSGFTDRGQIKEGLLADLVLLNEDFSVKLTLVGGKVKYRKP